MFGTQGLDGIDGFSELFSKLMGHVTRFTASAANSDHDVVQLHERGPNGLTDVMKPYHKYRKPVQSPYDSQVSGVPSDTAAALRRIQSDAKSMSLLTRTPSGRMLHGENSMLRTLTSCNSFSQLWLSDLLDAKERVRATVQLPSLAGAPPQLSSFLNGPVSEPGDAGLSVGGGRYAFNVVAGGGGGGGWGSGERLVQM